MFDRDAAKFSDRDYVDALSRFWGDEYLAKYLYGVYNPEFRIRKQSIKDAPELVSSNFMLEWGEKVFDSIEEAY